MGRDAAPVVARWGTGHPSAPLIVALHGRGASEASMIELAPWLPHGPNAYAAVRGPLEHGAGFAWYDNTEPERVSDSVAEAMARFLSWLDAEGDPHRPVILLGYSMGAAFAGALLLAEPQRWAGAVLLNGALSLHAAPPLTPGRLTGIPIYLSNGAGDDVIPAAARDATWDYLRTASGAPVLAEQPPGGHELAGATVEAVGRWLDARLAHLREHGENPLPDGDEPDWPALPVGRLPRRAGPPLQAGTSTADARRVVLPDALAYDALAKGWALPHPRAGVGEPSGTVLLTAPRDAGERDIAGAIAAAGRP